MHKGSEGTKGSGPLNGTQFYSYSERQLGGIKIEFASLMSLIASLVIDAEAESVDPTLAAKTAPASLGKEATERRDQSMSSSSSRVGG